MKNSNYLLLAFILFAFSSCMNEPDIQPNTNIGNFESLWKIIDTKYCYLDYKKINWDSIHTVYKTRVDSVKSEVGLFRVLGRMLDELKDGHVNLYSDFNMSRYWNWFTDYPSNFDSALIYSPRYLGSNYQIAGGFQYERIDNGNVGYIYYSSFSDYFSDTNIRYILQYFSNCKGLIIDVRNNGGGYLDLSGTLASYFFDKDQITGYICHKTGIGHSDFSTPVAIKTTAHKTIQWQRPVVILTNRMAFSATNAFICRMKYATHATIVGDKSGGGGGLPMSSEIPNGWMVRFSTSPMFDASMNQIEWGIDPDVKVALSTNDKLAGYDTLIEKAIRIIKQ